MSDDTVLIAGVQLLRDFNKANTLLKEKLADDLYALGIPPSLHPALQALMAQAEGLNNQINAEIAAKAPKVE